MKSQVWFGIIIVVLVIISVVVGSTVVNIDQPPRPRSREENESEVEVKTTRKSSKGESECRRVLSRIYGVSFPTVHPEWLRSTETGRKLELDCYGEIPASSLGMGEGTIAIACEYQGAQHYAHIPSMHKTEYQYQSQLWNDEYKRRLCEEYGVHLIIVPYTIKLSEIKHYIYKELEERCLLPMSVRK
jgi:hypothetical protein